MIKMAVEVGGTFTDLVWLDSAGDVRTHKVPSTPEDPSVGVVAGLDEALEGDLSALSQVFHGSTVATNAVIERKGCRAGLVTSRGFRDLLVLQRQVRPNVYAVVCRKAEPLIPLARTIEADERIDARGDIVTALDEAAFLGDLDRLVAQHRPQALAVCLLHAYQNPVHERRLKALVAERYPELPVVLSADVLPTFREYERASTTAIAAYLAPVVDRYLGHLERHLERHAGRTSLFVMQSSGGILPSRGAKDRGVEMLNSGPTAGVIAALRVSELVGDADIVTLDVGGTSADVCLVPRGAPAVTSETEINGLPVGMPSLDIANVGAGGGSIGWIDKGGMLQVGPESAGARPGPACYGHGGEAPTLTDALVELGWIRPHRFLGGRMSLAPERGRAALARLAGPLDRDPPGTAQAMVEIGAAHVSRCVRLVSVQRGHDPKGYALYGYGGMGPALSALVAAELKIDRVVIPPHPGLFSSLGLLVADINRIYRETGFLAVEPAAPGRIAAGFERLRAEALREFAGFGCAPERIVWDHALEMRYRGQGFELLTPVDLDRLRREGHGYLIGRFKETHRMRYGTAPPSDRCEVVTYRLVARVPGSREALDRLLPAAPAGRAPDLENGTVVFQGRPTPCRYAARDTLPPGFGVAGLAIIEEASATTLVPPGWRAEVGALGALVLRPEATT